MKRVVAWFILVAFLLPIGGALAGENNVNGYEISSFVIGAGGGHSVASPYTMDGTVGQATAGFFTLAGPYDECAGFWCWGWQLERGNAHLPLVLRGFP